ncbi:MAG: hypothetical protein CL739_03665 [Chloroflexi bacterium]|nr:hypothetical protein [Chloroflexota bacterium]MEC7836725.1 hypothetical protein [Chloroflexota bacterium]|tara:strand:+ start:1771 stop:2214 length:444 start_codon:yes stop_codon:yes gene_type:complete
MIDYVALVAQIATGAATLAVAIFLASQLKLQHRDLAESTRTQLTSGIVQWIGLMITDPGFTNIYLRGIEGDGSLDKEEQHRFNVFMVSYFLRIQQLWDYDNKSPDALTYANIMLGTGPGVLDWYRDMGRFVFKPGFVEYIDELIEKE